MTTPPLDLEAMAAQLYITLCRMEYDNVQGYRLPEKAILSALREVAEQKDKEIERLREETNKWEVGCRYNENCFKDAARKADNQRLEIINLKEQIARLTELVEKIRRLFNAWNHNRIVDEALAEDMEQLLNEATKKEV